MTSPEPSDVATSDRVGSYAGPATRLAAWIVDVFVAHLVFAVLAVTASIVVAAFAGDTVHFRVPSGVGISGDGVWLFLYFFLSWAVVGKTPGMTLVGLRVVRRDGTTVSPARAAVRALVFPFSFFFGLGLIGVVTGRERRALHDVAAGTTVVYD